MGRALLGLSQRRHQLLLSAFGIAGRDTNGDVIKMKRDSCVETQEITKDRRLFNQILIAADTLKEDLRLGKLHSLEDAFAEE